MNTYALYLERLALVLALSGLLLFLLLAGAAMPAGAQGTPTPVPLVTLIPPTLLPPAPTPTPLPPLTQSALARIKARDPQTLIVGIPYNIKPFAFLTGTGTADSFEVDGFEADLATAIAEDWGIKIRFRQVTRQTGISLLLGGQIDLLMGQVLLSRDAQTLLDFSDPIFVGRQVALTLAENPIKDISQLDGKSVGVVIGSRSEEALAGWIAASGIKPTVARQIMLDDGLRALGNKEIAALVADRWELDQAVRGKIQGVKLLEGVIRTEPYAIALARHDESLRILVNRTLQRLVAGKRLDPIYDLWFPGDLIPVEDRTLPRVWNGLDDDKRTLNDFPTDLLRPAQPVLARIKAGQPVRVAGLGAAPGPDGKLPVLDAFNQALVTEMARRWGVQIQVVPATSGKAEAENALASGQADLAVGLEPRWGTVDRFDYVGVYAERGYRMMVRVGSGIQTFAALREGVRTIGTFNNDPAAFDIARKLAASVGVREDAIPGARYATDDEAVQAVFNNNVRIFFADSFRLLPLAQANARSVELTKTLYERKPISFGAPLNDADFRVLVEITLQEMYRDGAYGRIWSSVFGAGTPPTVSMIIWPGTLAPFGVKTGG